MRLLVLIFILYSCLPGFSQHKQLDKNDGKYKLSFRFIETLSLNPIDSVWLISLNGDTIALSDEKGKAKINSNEKIKYITTYHPDFIPYNSKKLLSHFPVKSIKLKPKSKEYYRKAGSLKRNYLGIAVNEIFAGSIGIKYTYKLNVKNAIGSKLSIYNSSINVIRSTYSIYNGIKISFLYQLFLRENRLKGIFFEPKIIMGYFDSDFISYTYHIDESHHLTTNYSNNFFTVGAGLSFGFNAYISKTAIITFVLGLQALPCTAPSSIIVDGKEYRRHKYSLADYFEYFGGWNTVGPSAYLELKLLIGLKF